MEGNGTTGKMFTSLNMFNSNNSKNYIQNLI